MLGGAGAAYGVTQNSGNDRQAFLNDVAKRLKVTPDQLQSALKGAFEDRLDAAVKAGRLTQAQADEMKKRVEQGGGVPFVDPGPKRGFFFHTQGPVHTGIDAAAKYLGLTDKQLFDKLSSGKSLADVAGEQNKSVDGLKNAIRDSVKSDLDSDVKAGRLTQAQENQILDGLNSRLDDFVNGKGSGPGPRFRDRGAWGAKRGFGFQSAPAPPPDPPAGAPPGVPII